jgi:hypothetical protein
MKSYQEQSDAIIDAITIFSGKLHQHAADYLRREQLLSRAFLQYLLGIISGEVRPQASKSKQVSVAWETKFIMDRSSKRETLLTREFNNSMLPFEGLVEDLRHRLHSQLQHMMLKMRTILNGRDGEISARKSDIHKKLGKHVNKSCNARRLRLKNLITSRKDSNELESKCITSLGDISSDLRSGIEQIWVKQHLRERRMYEAVAGRMNRLEKSALIIWNKHSHLAIGEKEDASDWLILYRKDREMKMQERFTEMVRDNILFRNAISREVRRTINSVRKPLVKWIDTALNYSTDVTVDDNVNEIRKDTIIVSNLLVTKMKELQASVAHYVENEGEGYDKSAKKRVDGLVVDWGANLDALNDSINRRIGVLKDMECDLEETIRLTLIQHEAEVSIFEQQSCGKLDEFWVDWRERLEKLGGQLKHTLKEYEIALSTDNRAAGSRKIDDLVRSQSISTDLETIGSDKEALKKSSGYGQVKKVKVEKKILRPLPPPKVTDTGAIFKILEEIRQEVYREFSHKILRGFEQIQNKFGKGKNKIVPAFCVAKVFFQAVDWFFDRAKISERTIGNVTAKGNVLFKNGLPSNARATFCVGTTCSVLAGVLLQEDNRIDCEHVSKLLEDAGAKRAFLSGIMCVTQQLGSFGKRFILSECLTCCSNCGIPPPPPILESVGQEDLCDLVGSGFFSEDPADIVNSVLHLVMQTDEEILADKVAHDKAGGNKPKSEFDELDLMKIIHLDDRIPLNEIVPLMKENIPPADMTILVALLGRPDGSLEVTPYRFTQAVYMWRKTALAVIQSQLDPPSPEYGSLKEKILARDDERDAIKRSEPLQIPPFIKCLTPFDTVQIILDEITTIKGIPLSILQGLSIVSRGGSCDPWFEDPNQSCRARRFIYEINEFVEAMSCNDKLGTKVPFESILKQDIFDKLKPLDIAESDVIPIELLRSYILKENPNITNTQVSTIFWCICNKKKKLESQTLQEKLSEEEKAATEDVEEKKSLEILTGNENNEEIDNQLEVVTQTPLIKDPKSVNTPFEGDAELYMEKFTHDVGNFLESMPSLDTNSMVGMPVNAFSEQACSEIITTAVKLDPSARNAMPQSSVIWLGSGVMLTREAIERLSIPHKDGSFLVGSQKDLMIKNTGFTVATELLHELKVNVEIDILTRYSLICTSHAESENFSKDVTKPPLNEEDHWEELLTRRLNRVDKLTLSWRDIMVNEWANSLYISRQKRYQERAEMVTQAIEVYHSQYDGLKDTIVSERGALITRFKVLESELLVLSRDEKDFLAYHTSFLDRIFRMLEGQIENSVLCIKETLFKFVSHSGSIKRRSLERITLARDRLNNEVDLSCSGLIVGYTGGFAQGFFDELMYQGEVLRRGMTMMYGRLIDKKEKFIYAKEEIERDVTIQISDRITLDRNKAKGILDSLADDSAVLQDNLAMIRARYAEIQKSANSRIVLRVEKCVRESRVLRAAAEQTPEFEVPVLAEIRTVVDSAYTMCVSIVKQVRDECWKKLRSVEPKRVPHRDKMIARVESVKSSWQDCEEAIHPLIGNFEKEVFQQLATMNSLVSADVGEFRDQEIKVLVKDCRDNRVALIKAFRKHFSEFDLSEGTIFERYNAEVQDCIAEIKDTWGPTRPYYFNKCINDCRKIATDAMALNARKIAAAKFVSSSKEETELVKYSNSDETILHRMESNDMCVHILLDLVDQANSLPIRFENDYKMQLENIHSLGMNNNGDMVRPQVSAVLELLTMGIEIENDFTSGYTSLINATQEKCKDSMDELTDFVDKVSDPTLESSLATAAILLVDRVERRRDEVNTLLEASHSHMVADHSRMDVLMHSAEKDIEEWFEMTTKLIEISFKSAEDTYLCPVWPSPPPSPRPSIAYEDPKDDGRTTAIVAHIEEVQAEKDEVSKKTGQQYIPEQAVDYSTLERKELKKDSTPITLQAGWTECASPEGYTYYYNIDTGESLWELPAALKVPLGEPTVEEQAAEAEKNERVKALKEAERLAKEQANLDIEGDEMTITSVLTTVSKPKEGTGKKELTLQEKQALTASLNEVEGFTADPPKEESLSISTNKDMVGIVRRPDDDSTIVTNADGEKFIDTPRGLVQEKMDYSPTQTPRFIEDKTDMVVESKVVISILAQESRDSVQNAMDTALGITNVIRGAKRQGEGIVKMEIGNDGLYRPASPTNSVGQPDPVTPRPKARFMRDNFDSPPDTARDSINSLDSIESHDSVPEGQTDSYLGEDISLGESNADNKRFIVSTQASDMNSLDTTDFNISPRETTQGGLLHEIEEEVVTDARVWLTMSIGEKAKNEKLVVIDDDMGIEDQQLAARIIADEKYKESAERDWMNIENELTKIIEADFDVSQKEIFATEVFNILNIKSVNETHMAKLRHLAFYTKNVSVIEVFAYANTSWDLLNIRIFEDNEIAKSVLEAAERLKTEEGRERQAKIIEQKEDIDVMAAFMYEAGISKVMSKKGSIESILLNLATPQKLAKIWQKGQVELSALGLDADDCEDLQIALEKLLADKFAKLNNINQQIESYDQTGYDQTYDQNGYDQTGYNAEGQYDQNYDQTYQGYDQTRYNHEDYDKTAYNQEGYDQTGYYDQTYEEGYDQVTDYNVEGQYDTANNQVVEYAQYNSDWVEGYSEEGHLYFYNNVTGVSSWTRPEEMGPEPNQIEFYDVQGDQEKQDQGDQLQVEKRLETPQQDEQQIEAYDPNTSFTGSALSPLDMQEHSWNVEDAFGSGYNADIARERNLPIPSVPEVIAYAQVEGVSRQMVLHQTQENWEKSYNGVQNYMMEQQVLHVKAKEEMFKKVSVLVEHKLGSFVDDIKFMQRSLKSELNDLNAHERDMRRLFDGDSFDVIRAEIISQVLDGLEKLKGATQSRLESAYEQLDKFYKDWGIIKTELDQAGVHYDEAVEKNLKDCIDSIHVEIELFKFKQLDFVDPLKESELDLMRTSCHRTICLDTLEGEGARNNVRDLQTQHFYQRQHNRRDLMQKYNFIDADVEAELLQMDLGPQDPNLEVRPEEEVVMSYMIRQIEMESGIETSYNLIDTFTKKKTAELLQSLVLFADLQKESIEKDGSWFTKHHETIERHANALSTTLTRVRTKVNEGFTTLNAKIEALDFDVEKAAEDELAGLENADDHIGRIQDNDSYDDSGYDVDGEPSYLSQESMGYQGMGSDII